MGGANRYSTAGHIVAVQPHYHTASTNLVHSLMPRVIVSLAKEVRSWRDYFQPSDLNVAPDTSAHLWPLGWACAARVGGSEFAAAGTNCHTPHTHRHSASPSFYFIFTYSVFIYLFDTLIEIESPCFVLVEEFVVLEINCIF